MIETFVAPELESGPKADADADEAAVPSVLPAGCGPCLTNQGTRRFADLLGHDALGHCAHEVLADAGFAYTTEIALTTDTDLLALRDMDADVLARIRARIPCGEVFRESYSPTVLMHRLPQGLAVEPWMYVEPDRAAPLWLLSEFAADDPRIWPHVHKTSINFRGMYNNSRGFRDDERMLLRAAHCLYTKHIGVDLAAAAALLSETAWAALLEAMRIRRDGSRSTS